MRAKLTFLGTGSSTGTPVLGCTCAVCTSLSPRNQRLRPSILLEVEGKTLLFDVGPDFRAQALRYGISHLDGLIITHTHFDHIAGIDELRAFNFKRSTPIPCLLSEESLVDLQTRYCYLFKETHGETIKTAKFHYTVLSGPFGEAPFLGLPFQFVKYNQCEMKVTGFRLGSFAYITDIRQYEPAILARLAGVKTLILSSLYGKHSDFHLSFSEAIAFSQQVGASQTWLTHMGHQTDHEEGNRNLPPDVQLAYDGQLLELTL